MTNQENSRDGIPRKDQDRPSPDVQRDANDGQVGVRSTGSGATAARSEAGDAGGAPLDFDDGTDMVHPRGNTAGAGRTAHEKNPSDAGRLGTPNPGLSDRNGPSDPDNNNRRGQ